MAESQQVHGGGSTRAGEHDGPRHSQRGGQQAAQQGNRPGKQATHVAPDPDHHGQSTAAWTAVAIIFVGALVMSIAVVIATKWLFAVGAVIAIAGGISGKVLSAMGFGASGRPGH